jgi:hypothetical protein
MTRSLEIIRLQYLGEESNSAQDSSLSSKKTTQTDASGQNMHYFELSALNGKRSVPETDKSKRWAKQADTCKTTVGSGGSSNNSSDRRDY